jgi:hypothetical protein
MLVFRLIGWVLLSIAASAAAQSVSIEELAPAKIPGGHVVAGQPAAGGGISALPLKTIAIYKNGVALFERSGIVTGDALIHIDFTTAQLNDVLQSLTVTDLGGGTVAGLGYDNTATLGEQLRALRLNLGPDPTVGEFLQALKGTRVQVHGGGPDVTGKLLNVEVRPATNAKTGERTERRFVSVITEKGGLRTIELTPLVEVRMVDSEQRVEIGHYLQLLSTTHDPPLRHLTLETRGPAGGTGKREIRISYIGSMPAWKSNYRVLVTGAAKTATLQGWAVVDNGSEQDWTNVQLTLISGAPSSFIQPVSRPNNISRPEIGMQGRPSGTLSSRAAADPIGSAVGWGSGAASVPITGGLQISPKIPAPLPPVDSLQAQNAAGGFQQEARNSLAPRTNSVATDDLFEYKLDQPRTIRAGESAVIPIVQTTVAAERVSLWLSREPGRGVQRALWLTNTSDLTLDQGSFTIMEDGVFAGQGQLPLTHAGGRRLAPYGQDQETKVTEREAREPPFRLTHLVIENGVLTGHHKTFNQRDFTIENPGATARTVVLGVRQSDNKGVGNWGPWELDTPAEETIGSEPTGKLYRFAVQVAPRSTQGFTVMESKSHPVKTPVDQLSIENIGGIIHESGNNSQVIAMLQPIADAKKKLADLETQMKEQQKGIDEVNTEEARLRQNMGLLKGGSEEKPLAKRYADEMLAQEDKLAVLRRQREQAQQEKSATRKALDDQIHALQADIVFPHA